NNTELKALPNCWNPYIWNFNNLTDSTATATNFTSHPIWQVAGNSIGFANYHNANGGDYRLCKGAGNPASACTGASVFAAGQANQASDGTDLGANAAGLSTIETQVRSGRRTP